MKKIIVSFVALYAALGIYTASAATINVAEQYLSSTSYATPSEEQLSKFQTMLTSHDIDFAYFHGPSAVANFGFTCDGYTVDKETTTESPTDTFILVYKTSKWSYVNCIGPECTSKKNAVKAIIMQNSNGEQFAFILTSGNRWDPEKSSYYGCLNNTLTSVASNYSDAKIIICGMYQTSSYPLTNLASYLDTNGTHKYKLGGYTTYYAGSGEKANYAAFFVKTGVAGLRRLRLQRMK